MINIKDETKQKPKNLKNLGNLEETTKILETWSKNPLKRSKEILGLFKMKRKCFLFCNRWTEVVMILNDLNLSIFTKEAFSKFSYSKNQSPLIRIEFANILKINKRQISREDINTISIQYFTSSETENPNAKAKNFIKNKFKIFNPEFKEIRLKCDTRFEFDYYMKLFYEIKFTKFWFQNFFDRNEISLTSYLEDEMMKSAYSKYYIFPDRFHLKISNLQSLFELNFMTLFFEKLKEKTNYKENINCRFVIKSEYEMERVESFEEEMESNDYLNENDIIMFDSN